MRFAYAFSVAESAGELDGSATIDMTLANPTTVESFTRIPYARDMHYIPGKVLMASSNHHFGAYESAHQTISSNEN